jgi:CIC family chloride channel protein
VVRGHDSSGAGRIPLPRGLAWATWLRESPSALVPLAVAVGVVTGLGAVGFRW